jgi:hypothetical protein
MSLYLCIFSGTEEIAGADLGAYSDYNACRNYVIHHLEDGRAGSRFPIFTLHSDCSGEWTCNDCARLRDELLTIAAELYRRPPEPWEAGWQRDLAERAGWAPRSAVESFIDVDGEPIFTQLLRLATIAVERKQSLLFQ